MAKFTVFKVIFMLMTALMIASCSRMYSTVGWQSKPVVIDGDITEWGLPLTYYDPETKLNYSLTNDATDLYIGCRVSDEMTQMKILRSGFAIWIDSTAKKKQTSGIIFPIRPDQRGPMKRNYEDNPGSKQNLSNFRQQMIANQKVMVFKGLKNIPEGKSTSTKEYGIAVAINFDKSGDLVYEAKIPFASFYHPQLTLSDTARKWSVGLMIYGMEKMNKENRMSGETDDAQMPENRPGMDRSSSNFGGGHGGMGRFDSGMNNEISETNCSWNFIHFSLKK